MADISTWGKFIRALPTGQAAAAMDKSTSSPAAGSKPTWGQVTGAYDRASNAYRTAKGTAGEAAAKKALDDAHAAVTNF